MQASASWRLCKRYSHSWVELEAGEGRRGTVEGDYYANLECVDIGYLLAWDGRVVHELMKDSVVVKVTGGLR